MNRPRRRILAAAVLVGAGCASAALGAARQSTTVYLVPVEGVIEMGVAPFVERSIREATAAGAAAVVLDINTPGGRVDAAERIADAVTTAGIPVYAFVNPRAFSAGALISLATDRIFMVPAGVIGAATPVDGSTGQKAPEKIVSAMRSEMRALAESNGLDPAVAEAMVDEQIAIAGIVAEGELLTLTTSEAVEVGYAVAVDDLSGLLGELGIGGAEVVRQRLNWAERLVRIFSHPVVAPFLLSLGFLGLLVEIKTPSFGLAGSAGIASLALFFGSHLLVGLAGIEDLIVFGIGIVLLLIEIILIPGFGIFGILGLLGILGGIFMSLIGRMPTVPDLAQASLVLATSVLFVIMAAWALLRHLPSSGRLARSGVFLATATSRDAGYSSQDRRADLIGRVGRAITDLRPAGVAMVDEERLDVVSESAWVEEGTPVVVVRSEGYRLVVRPTTTESVNQGEGS